jgi:hypothetical protein
MNTEARRSKGKVRGGWRQAPRCTASNRVARRPQGFSANVVNRRDAKSAEMSPRLSSPRSSRLRGSPACSSGCGLTTLNLRGLLGKSLSVTASLRCVLRAGSGPFGPLLVLVFLWPALALASTPDALFRTGAEAYHAGDYSTAAAAFRQTVMLHPASGTLLNLGNAEWQLGHTGPAILAWEQAEWLSPFNGLARANLRFARKTAQLETPELAWYEAVASWLPLNWWSWIAALSLWLIIGLGLLPGIFRLRKAAWHQAAAAFGLAVFLLSVPAHLGVHTRSRIGFVLQKDTPLRLTATDDAQYLTRLSAGEPARVERNRGRYLLIRTNRGLGWIEEDRFGLIGSPAPHP